MRSRRTSFRALLLLISILFSGSLLPQVPDGGLIPDSARVGNVTMGQVRFMAAEKLAYQRQLALGARDSTWMDWIIAEQQTLIKDQGRMLDNSHDRFISITSDYNALFSGYTECRERNSTMKPWVVIGKVETAALLLTLVLLIVTNLR